MLWAPFLGDNVVQIQITFLQVQKGSNCCDPPLINIHCSSAMYFLPIMACTTYMYLDWVPLWPPYYDVLYSDALCIYWSGRLTSMIPLCIEIILWAWVCLPHPYWDYVCTLILCIDYRFPPSYSSSWVFLVSSHLYAPIISFIVRWTLWCHYYIWF